MRPEAASASGAGGRRRRRGATFALALALVLSPIQQASGAPCGTLPAGYPISSATRIEAETGLTMNGNAVASGTTNANSVIQTNGLRATAAQTLPDLTPTSFPPNSSTTDATEANSPFVANTDVRYRNIMVNANKTASFSGGGPFHITKLAIKGGATVNLGAGTYFIDTLEMNDNLARLRVTSAPVLLHIGTEFKMDADDLSLNAGGSVDGLQVFLHAGAKFNGDAKGKRLSFTGLVYGPASGDVGVGESATFRGMILVSGRVKLKKNSAYSYSAADQTALAAVDTCAAPSCQLVPGTYPLYSRTSIEIKNRDTMNGTTITAGTTGANSAVQTNAARTTLFQTLPDLVPRSFPANSSTTDVTETSSPFVATSAVYYRKIRIGKNKTASFSGGGPFHIDELSIDQNGVVNLAAGIYFVNKLKGIDTGARINVTSQPVVMHIGSELNFNKNDQFINAGGSVTGFRVFMHAAAQVKPTGDRLSFTGFLYGPNTGDIVFGKFLSFRGAIVTGGKIKIDDDATLTYSASDQAAVSGSNTCATAKLDHFLLTHDGFGIHCLAETVSLLAVDTGQQTYDTYIGTVVLDTQSGKGTWSNGAGNQGSFLDATANDGLALYTFSALDRGVASFGLSYGEGSASIDVDVYQQGSPSLRDDDAEGMLAWSPSGFTVTANQLSNPPPSPISDPIPTQVAGTGFALHLTAYGTAPTDPTCGVIEAYTGSKSLKFWSSYSDPATGSVAVSVDGSAIATSRGAAAAQSVSFTNGRASVSAKYKDVGRIQIQMVDDTTTEPVAGILGATNLFVVKPSSFAITAIERPDLTANPGASLPTGSVFVKAGDPFRVTVEARDDEGSRTPNYGNESTPEGIRLRAATLVAPAGGRNGSADDGAIGNASAFTAIAPAGTFRGTTFSWDEVGAIRLQASVADASYLGVGDVSGAISGDVGRFTPHHFDVALTMTPSFATGCAAGSFTYLEQPFGFSQAPVLTVTARAAAGTATRNYAGSWWTLTNTSLTGRSYTSDPAAPASLDTSGLPPTATDPTIAILGNGVGTLTFSTGSGLRFARATPVAPFDAELRLSLNVLDADGVAYASNPFAMGQPSAGNGIAFSAGKRMRYGRLALENAYGSELVALAAALRAQYYDGSGFVTNADDSCTLVSAANVGTSARSPAALATTPSLARVPLLAGDGGQSWSPPGQDGHADALVNLGSSGIATAWGTITAANLPWLRFDWSGDGAGTPNQDPTARITFGIYAGPRRVIFRREIY